MCIEQLELIAKSHVKRKYSIHLIIKLFEISFKCNLNTGDLNVMIY